VTSPRKITTRTNAGITESLYTDMQCLHCGVPMKDFWFARGEPVCVLCERCTTNAMRDDSGLVSSTPFKPNEVRHVAGESEPGQSSGRPHNYMGSLDGGGNANGIWDNLIKDMEDAHDNDEH
jgi:hypothetical protein